MTDFVERYTVDALLPPDAGARLMRPRLHRVGVHWHDYYELCLVVDGAGEHVLNGVRSRLGRGSAFLLTPADFHEIRADGPEPVTCFNTVIDAAVMESRLTALGSAAVDGLPWRTDDFLDAEPDFLRLEAEFELGRLGSAAVTGAIITCLVVELARRCAADRPAGPRAPAADEGVRRAVRYVDRHFREPLTLAAAAAQAHLSANYFSERFRVCTGTSFQLYLQERRLRFARSLLRATNLGVAEVCHAAGFHDLSHFGRAYRRRYGVSPSADRDHGSGNGSDTPGARSGAVY